MIADNLNSCATSCKDTNGLEKRVEHLEKANADNQLQFNSQKITTPDLNAKTANIATLTSGGVTAEHITGGMAELTSLVVDGDIKAKNFNITEPVILKEATVETANVGSGNITNLATTTANIKDLTVENITLPVDKTFEYKNLSVTNEATINKLNLVNPYIARVEADSNKVTNSEIQDLTVTGVANIAKLDVGATSIDDLTTKNVRAETVTSNEGNIDSFVSKTVSTDKLSTPSATITNADITGLAKIKDTVLTNSLMLPTYDDPAQMTDIVIHLDSGTFVAEVEDDRSKLLSVTVAKNTTATSNVIVCYSVTDLNNLKEVFLNEHNDVCLRTGLKRLTLRYGTTSIDGTHVEAVPAITGVRQFVETVEKPCHTLILGDGSAAYGLTVRGEVKATLIPQAGVVSYEDLAISKTLNVGGKTTLVDTNVNGVLTVRDEPVALNKDLTATNEKLTTDVASIINGTTPVVKAAAGLVNTKGELFATTDDAFMLYGAEGMDNIAQGSSLNDIISCSQYAVSDKAAPTITKQPAGETGAFDLTVGYFNADKNQPYQVYVNRASKKVYYRLTVNGAYDETWIQVADGAGLTDVKEALNKETEERKAADASETQARETADASETQAREAADTAIRTELGNGTLVAKEAGNAATLENKTVQQILDSVPSYELPVNSVIVVEAEDIVEAKNSLPKYGEWLLR